MYSPTNNGTYTVPNYVDTTLEYQKEKGSRGKGKDQNLTASYWIPKDFTSRGKS